MQKPDWLRRVREELYNARMARKAGNEGKARVCARRAAGIISGEYLRRNTNPQPGSSALRRLAALYEYRELDSESREVLGHFLGRVTPEHVLPYNVDLIEEAEWLAQRLLGTSITE